MTTILVVEDRAINREFLATLLSYAGYVLAAPDAQLQAIMAGEDVDPIPTILESALGTIGSKVFLVITVQ